MPGPTITMNDRPHTIAESIYVARRHAGYTQIALAAKLGCCHSQLSVWEHGREISSVKRWIEVLAACGFRVVIEPIRRDK